MDNRRRIDGQHIIWPWETKKWTDVKQKVADKINSIVDMDTRIASIYLGKLRPRQITELFNSYWSDDQYIKDRVSAEMFITKIIPMMQKFIIDAPKTFKGFNAKLLVPGQTTNIVLTRPQVATIIAGIWFGIFDYNYISKGKLGAEHFPEPTFVKAFANQNIFVLQCLINYFARVYEYINDPDENARATFNAGNIIIKRHCIKEQPDWININKPLSEIFIGEGSIDDAPTKMHTAYAHEFIGGNIFENSLTQEEVILLIRPECIISTLFCARMDDNETITILGSEKISQYIGYGSSIRFAGNFVDTTPKGYSADETEVMTQSAVIFMDASPRTSGISQFVGDFERDLNKAYCGFSSLTFSSHGEKVASGHWTYAFNGNNMQIKFIQQVLAASMADKCLVYYPFGRDFDDKITPFVDWMARNKLTVGELFGLYVELIKKCYSGPNSRFGDLDIIECIMEA